MAIVLIAGFCLDLLDSHAAGLHAPAALAAGLLVALFLTSLGRLGVVPLLGAAAISPDPSSPPPKF